MSDGSTGGLCYLVLHADLGKENRSILPDG
jgi:hypothetical protein